ncbi:MAG: 4-hydroxybutyrate--acetyl-CoA CoA transferase, partial [Oscillospiraceae bacterium]|nr:4-hydroxybutyrate--acetyl-CoA CoA transferase [Oscillospiraceae bacterium]
MNVAERYRSKCMSTEEALALLRSGDEVVSSFGAGEACAVLNELHTIADRIGSLAIWMSMTIPDYPFLSTQEYLEIFEVNVWFGGPATRKAQKIGPVSFQPCHLHSLIHRKYQSSVPRVYMGRCTQPDKHGYVKTSMSVIYEPLAINKAEVVIMEANPNLPEVWGDTAVHIDRVTAFVESDLPAQEIHIAPVSEKDRAIGRLVSSLVDDGDTVQLGIGSIPNAVAQEFTEKRRLGIHTEMITSSMADLVEAGVIDGSRKTLYPGKMVGTFILGDQKLYDF